jgi:hypothetical protein
MENLTKPFLAVFPMPRDVLSRQIVGPSRITPAIWRLLADHPCDSSRIKAAAEVTRDSPRSSIGSSGFEILGGSVSLLISRAERFQARVVNQRSDAHRSRDERANR